MKPGVAFGEHIFTEKIARRRIGNNDDFSSSKISFRDYILPIILVLCGIALIVRLIMLQFFQGSYYRQLADSNRIRTSIVHAPRGIISDRNGTPLVLNVPGFRKVDEEKISLMSREEAIQRIARGEQGLEVDALRQYPYKDMFAHVIGYIGQISKEELKADTTNTYRGGDLIGKMGIEKEYEQKLIGIDGKQLVEVDSRGKPVRSLGQTDPIPGQDISLSVDAKLQKAAYEALEDIKKGVVIVSTPQGELLSLVSKPSFDPNLFTMGTHYTVATDEAYPSISKILTDSENQPMLNRAISGTYPPGSTFKLITAATGLQDNSIDEKYQVEDTGVLQVGEFSFANWYYVQYGKKEGSVDVIKAIQRSNDIFFYKLAEKIGVEKLSAMGALFGLGKPLGIDLEGEASGNLPTDEWKRKHVGEGWYLGDSYHYGIGQGYLLTTPLQVNAWTQVIANGGALYQPRLIKNITNSTNITNNLIRKNILNEKTISLIKQGMIRSCSPEGVAWPLFKLKIKNEKLKIDGKNYLEVTESSESARLRGYRELVVACKTGTAQHGGEDTLPHAWITLFAPAENPQIVITVLAESSGEGSNVAAPVAKKVLEEWFGR